MIFLPENQSFHSNQRIFLLPMQDITLDYSRVVYGTVGAIVRLAVLNLSDRNYNGSSYNGADNLGFSITKLGEYIP